MAGWPFAPLALNVKCLIFSGALIMAYMYLPCRYDRSWQFSVFAIGLSSYIGLAWYDHAYGCRNKMRVGMTAPLTKWFKLATSRGVYG